MRYLLILLVACTAGEPAVRPVTNIRGLQAPFESGVTLVRDNDGWQDLLGRQHAEQAMRLRALEIDFTRETFVLAHHTATSGSTRVRFAAPRFEGNLLVIEAHTSTPSGPVRADMVTHCYAAVVAGRNFEAVLRID